MSIMQLPWLSQARRIAILGAALPFAWGGAAADDTDTGAPADRQLFTVLNPIGIAPAIERRSMATRPGSLGGKTVYLVDVTFNGGDLFLLEMQKWMAANMPEVDTVFRVKRGYYAADDPELWREIQAVDGLMIMAIGH